MHISSCLWAKKGTAQPLPVPSSCIFCSFYPLFFFSRAPAARRPDPGGQWRFPNWGYKWEVLYPNGNLAFLLLLYNSVKWFGLQVAWRIPVPSLCPHCDSATLFPRANLGIRNEKFLYRNRPVDTNCICEIFIHPPTMLGFSNSSWHSHSICCSFPSKPHSSQHRRLASA